MSEKKESVEHQKIGSNQSSRTASRHGSELPNRSYGESGSTRPTARFRLRSNRKRTHSRSRSHSHRYNSHRREHSESPSISHKPERIGSDRCNRVDTCDQICGNESYSGAMPMSQSEVTLSRMSSNRYQTYGIFWDIENCPIPKGMNAANVVQSLHQFVWDKAGPDCELRDFVCAANTNIMSKKHIDVLNRKGVDIQHVNIVGCKYTDSGQFKVNADWKLKVCIQKFIDHYSNRSLIVVITSDIDFGPIIQSAKRSGFEVILLCGRRTSIELKYIAPDNHLFRNIISPLLRVVSRCESKTSIQPSKCRSYGIIWDIYTRPLPKIMPIAKAVQYICQLCSRQFSAIFGHTLEPCMFCIVCDAQKLDLWHVECLNRMGVDILHVNSVDNFDQDRWMTVSKLRISINKFIKSHKKRKQLFLLTGSSALFVHAIFIREFQFIKKFSYYLKNIIYNLESQSSLLDFSKLTSPFDLNYSYSDRSVSKVNELISEAKEFISEVHGLNPELNERFSLLNKSIANILSIHILKEKPMQASNVGITSNQPSVAPVVTPVIGPIRLSPIRPESGDRSRSQNRNSDQSTVEFDSQIKESLQLVMEVTDIKHPIPF